MAIGATKQDILHSTLNGLKVYDKAHLLRQESQDYMLYLSGLYTYEAVSVALANAFRKHGSKAIEYRKEPILQQIKPPSEEMIKKKRKEFIAKMETMMNSFKATHQEKNDAGE